MKNLDYYLKWFLRIGIGCAAIYDLFVFNWKGIAGGAAIVLTTFLIDFVNRNKKVISSSLSSIYYIYCVFSLICGVMLSFYDIISWWDLLMHLFSGIILALAGNMLLNKVSQGKKVNPVIRLFFTIGIACLGGVAWEIYEFTFDSLFMQDTQRVLLTGVRDTMGDLIADLIGGVIAGLYFAVFDRRGI